MRALSIWIERINLSIGRAMGWLLLILVLLVTMDVIGRYLFNFGAVIIQETEWWLFSIIFLSGAGYTFLYDDHVRVDIIYSRLKDNQKCIVDIICGVIFLFPMCILLIWTSFWWIGASWEVREFSPDPGGLCCYYVLKAFIPFGFSLLFLQGVVHIYKKIQQLRGLETTPMPDDALTNRTTAVPPEAS